MTLLGILNLYVADSNIFCRLIAGKSYLEHCNAVSIPDSGQPVSHHNGRAEGLYHIKSGLQQSLPFSEVGVLFTGV